MSDNNDSSSHPPPAPPDQHSTSTDTPVINISGDGGAAENTKSGFLEADPTIDESAWMPFFPFDEAYDQQIDGIDTLTEALSEEGYVALEGACGTGKTMLALSGALTAIRNPSGVASAFGRQPDLSHVVAVTPIKSQLAQFVEEAKAINRRVPDGTSPAPTLVLRGKSDLIPHAAAEAHPDDLIENESLHDATQALRDTAASLSEPNGVPIRGVEDGRFTFNEAADHLPNNVGGPDNPKDVFGIGRDNQALDIAERDIHDSEDELVTFDYDPRRAYALAEYIRKETASTPYLDPLTVDGEETPFPAQVLRGEQVVDLYRLAAEHDDYSRLSVEKEVKENFTEAAADGKTEVDDFDDLSSLDHALYADDETVFDLVPEAVRGYMDPFALLPIYRDVNNIPLVRPEHAPNAVLDRDGLLTLAAGEGICPHSAMVDAMQTADIEIYLGNYYHIFDPDTRNLTADATDMISDTAGLIVDEAHEVVDRVRDILSEDLSYSAITHAQGDLEDLERILQNTRGFSSIEDFSGSNEDIPHISQTEYEQFRELLEWIQSRLFKFGTVHIEEDDYLSKWSRDWFEANQSQEVPLREPKSGDEDKLTKALSETDHFDEIADDLQGLAMRFGQMHEELEESNRTTEIESVGKFLTEWQERSHEDYFRYIDLDPNNRTYAPETAPNWMAVWEPRFTLYNTLPQDALADIFEEFAGGIAMSATLEPLNVFTETVGLKTLERGTDRPLFTKQYPLAFPEENRASYTVPHNEFTRKNRGDPTQNLTEMSHTRRKYTGTIKDIAHSDGNILIAMPSYEEAHWAVDILRADDHLTKDVLKDGSTKEPVTKSMLDDFFSGGSKVLVTSARGTVTTGVDYDGDKLHSVAVVGVPYPPAGKPTVQATMHSYGQAFSDSEFSEYELVIGIPCLRRVRQTFGRVIRATDERGTRILVDERYDDSGWRSVTEHLSEQEQEEFTTIPADHLTDELDRFWN